MSANGSPSLEVRNVTRRFGGLAAVDGVSFEVRQGEILGLIGPNGGLRAAGQRADEALETVGLAAKADWPVDQLTLADRKVLELGRALAMGPHLLLLDEVMAGLTPAEIDGKLALLRVLNAQGVT